jgi:hypothetical protein
MKLSRRDVTGVPLRVGQTVRVIGVPDLSGMSRQVRAESLRVFRYLVGKYKRIAEFDQFGRAGLWLRIPSGRDAGRHFVVIEPELLRVRRSRAG